MDSMTSSNDLQAPHVDPIGLVRYPTDYEGRPRRYSKGLRLVAFMVLVVFAGVVVVTTGVSLGAYCLTSDAGNYAALADWLAGAGR